ncbi:MULTISPECIES: glycosyltransferase [Rahnella]|uniref:Glycosyltransferase n=1 Tax=Rahnella laticis TaxID=2787622 RepID=A0ABS0E591_9GAMM|nr:MULTISPECIES: glycosyltransferase [Rahnella]MBF7980261.1 glycosyltransferase [Rahnella laticis]MBF8000480.1 glycosyltransferase [Rahnella sp. LAC-M12]
MKILFATYPMAFHTPGGGEIQLLAYKHALERKGIKVDLMNLWEPKFLDYDVVHFFSCMGGSVHFCNFIKKLGLPLVISSSLWMTPETKHLYPSDEIRSQLSLADVVVTNSELESDALSEVLSLPREIFSAVYNGVDDIFFEDKPDPSIFRKKFEFTDDFILNVANIEPRKNQLNLVKAMTAFPDKKLVLIGHIRNQDYYDEVMSLKNSHQVHYVGPLEHHSEMLRSAYQACELFCLPSTLETPGLAALEARAQDVKLVVTSEGSTKEYFSENAFYCDFDSVEDILNKISRCLNSEKVLNDNEKVYNWPSATNSLVDIYRKLKRD